MDKPDEAHLGDDQLLLHADGELADRDEGRVRAHLDACWSCRTRLDELQATIHTLVRFRQEVLLASAPPPPSPWPGLLPKLEAVDHDGHGRTVLQRVRHALWLSSSASAQRRLAFAAAAVVVVLLLLPGDAMARLLAQAGSIVTLLLDRLRGDGAPTAPLVVRPFALDARVEFRSPVNSSGVDLAPSTRAVPAPVDPVGLEIDALARLDRVGLLLGQRAEVSRFPAGIRVRGVVTDPAEEHAIFDALGSLARAPSVAVNLRAASPPPRPATDSTTPVVIRDVEPRGTEIPAGSALHRYFQSRGDEDAIRIATREFAQRVLDRSRQALLHAGVLRDLVQRFNAVDLRALQPARRSVLDAMITSHAQDVQRYTALLRIDLQPVFFSVQPAETAPPPIEASAVERAEQLLFLTSAHDRAVRAAFTLSAEPQPVTVGTDAFWQSLRAVEELAVGLQSR